MALDPLGHRGSARLSPSLMIRSWSRARFLPIMGPHAHLFFGLIGMEASTRGFPLRQPFKEGWGGRA